MAEETVYYRRNLPHVQPVQAFYFITFRLVDTIPRTILNELIEKRIEGEQIINKRYQNMDRQIALYQFEKKQFGAYDAWLDRCKNGSRWLEEEKVANIVADEIHRLDHEGYRLLSYCIMPNHIHLLIDMANFTQKSLLKHNGATSVYPLTDTLRLLKGRTARYSNQVLKRTGQFWHHESYDHVVRDQAELERIVHYILENPVKAGLAINWREWKFSFVCAELAT